MKHISILKNNLLRAAMTLALIVTCATAWAQTRENVSYIDANGQAQTVNATVLTGSESDLGTYNQTTWYVVNSNITHSGQIIWNGHVNIILADDKTMTVNGGSSNAFANNSTNSNSLTIYGQSGQSGTLTCSSSSDAIVGYYSGSFVVNGGIVNVTGGSTSRGIYTRYVTLNGGNVTVNGNPAICIEYPGNIAINGGNVTVNGNTGIYSKGNITLSWRNANDRIFASRYYVGSGYQISIAEGKYFKDANNNNSFFFGNVNANSINGKTLQPATRDEYVAYSFSHNVSGSGTAQDPYVISTTDGWNAFCDKIDIGESFSGKYFKLDANIGTTQSPITRMAGSNTDTNVHAFSGAFDGRNHTLTFNCTATSNYVAPFANLNGTSAAHASVSNLNVVTTITAPDCRHIAGLIAVQTGYVDVSNCHAVVDLNATIGTHNTLDLYPAGLVSQAGSSGTLTISGCTVTGTIATDGKYASGFIGVVQGAANITNCASSVTINSSTAGDGTHAGFIAANQNNNNIAIEGCLFNGKLLTVGETATGNCAGFMGWRNTNYLTISNCLYAPAELEEGENEVVAGTGNYPSCTFVRNWTDTPSNNYFTRTLNTVQGKQARSITAGNYVTVVNAETPVTVYDISGITTYTTGIKCNDVLYAGENDMVSLTLGNTLPATYGFFGYTVDHGTLNGNDNDGYTLNMPDENVTITADYCASPANLHIVGEISYYSVTMAWDNVSGEVFEYALTTGHNIDLTTVTYDGTTTASEMIWNNLDPDSDYTIVLRKQCSTDHYSQPVALEIHTESTCPAPTLALVDNSITPHGATFTWTGMSDNYDVQVAGLDETTFFEADFEDNQMPNDFTNSTDYPWTITDADKNAGTYAIKSGGAGTDNATSDLTLVLDLTDEAIISFWCKVSSEDYYDYGRFYINGTNKFSTYGTSNSWTQYTFSLTAGTNTLVWSYEKDSSNHDGDDCFYVDDITITGNTMGTWQTVATGITENTYVMDDASILYSATRYFVKVVGHCPLTSEETDSNIIEFTTDCGDFIVVDAAHPFTEGFEGEDFAPHCWENISLNTTNQWCGSNSHHSGFACAYSGYYGDIYLVMPPIQLSASGTLAQLTFWSYNSYPNDYSKGKNYVVLLEGENETELWSPESVTSTWEETTIDLTAYMGQTISLAFKYEGNNAHGWHVDDVEVKVVTPVTHLYTGWNWWTPMVSTDWEALHTALGDNLLTVKSKDGVVTTGGALIPGQMYKIRVSEDYVLTVTGLPTDVSVTIAPGYNWFGYTRTESLSIATALGSFTPAIGDKIISQNEGFAIFNGSEWEGTLTQLVPGRGYVYVSKANQSKTLTF